MTVNEFASQVCLAEGKKVSISIGQVREVLRIVNIMLDGEVYKLIKKINKK